jgi:hypothetical protein
LLFRWRSGVGYWRQPPQHTLIARRLLRLGRGEHPEYGLIADGRLQSGKVLVLRGLAQAWV